MPAGAPKVGSISWPDDGGHRVLRVPRLVALAIVVPLVVAARLDHHYLSWGLGLAAGGLMALWVSLRETPPPHIENWRTGAQGERRTARVLAPLRRAGWVLFHDLADASVWTKKRQTNIDHVAVGPPGIFLLDSKWLGGAVTVEGDVVHVQRRDDEESSYHLGKLAGAVRARAASLYGDLKMDLGRPPCYVTAVVVLWDGLDAGIVEGDRIVFVAGDRLASWLAERPEVMPAPAVRRAALGVANVRPARNPETHLRRPRWMQPRAEKATA